MKFATRARPWNYILLSLGQSYSSCRAATSRAAADTSKRWTFPEYVLFGVICKYYPRTVSELLFYHDHEEEPYVYEACLKGVDITQSGRLAGGTPLLTGIAPQRQQVMRQQYIDWLKTHTRQFDPDHQGREESDLQIAEKN